MRYNRLVTDKIGDLLPTKRFDEPPEIKIIKDFVLAKFKTEPQVTIKPDQIIIAVSGAALAGALRMHLYELQQRCATNKRLIIRIV